MDKRNAIWAVAAIAVVAILFLLMQPPKPTGLFIGLFAVCPNGICEADDPYDPYDFGETFETCPEDCCTSACTAEGGSVCHASCVGFPLANPCAIKTNCNGKALGDTFCANPSTLITCCSTQTTCSSTPGSGTYCTTVRGAGNCVSCSTACDNACQSPTCYGTDLDCTASGAATAVCCGDGACDSGETCTGCPGDCGGCTVSCGDDVCGTGETCDSCPGDCPPACDTNAACNLDNNALTVDVCNTPGTCTAACSRLCVARCADNAGCNDSNSLTTDTCLRPGACDADCNYVPTCSIRCDENSDCSDGLPLTFDICNNPDTCSSSCSNPACTAACSYNANCADDDPLNVDTCRNPGTCAARCTNLSCVVNCDANSDCNDHNSSTVDACVNPGSCDSRCSRTPCRVACTGDANCNDNNAMTVDTCLNPGACTASCSHSRQQLSIELQVGFETVVVRGQTVDLTLMVKDDAGNPVSDAVVSLTDAEGNTITFNSVGDGYYTGQYTVSSNSPLGTKRFSFSAESDGKVAVQELSLDVVKGNIAVVLVQPTELSAAVGQEVEIKFRLVYDNDAVVQGAAANAVLNGTAVSLQSDGGTFTGKYLFSEKDVGQVNLVINAVDGFGNTGAMSFVFNVAQPFPLVLLALLLLLIIAIAVALYTLKKKRGEKPQVKWAFEKEQ